MPRPLLTAYKAPPIDETEQDRLAQEEYDKLDPVSQKIRDIVSIGTGIMGGLLGSPYNPDPTGQPHIALENNRANAATQTLINLLPVFGVTKYLKGGIPDIAAREAATAEYVTKMKAMGMGDIGQEFAMTHPRIAAHTLPEHAFIGDMPQGVAMTNLERAFDKNNPTKIPVIYNDANPDILRSKILKSRGMQDTTTTNKMRNTAYHEGTHVAQTMGLGGAEREGALYDLANLHNKELFNLDDRTSYFDNPFEQSARSVARRKTGYEWNEGLQRNQDKPVSAMDLIDDLVSKSVNKQLNLGNSKLSDLDKLVTDGKQVYGLGDSFVIKTPEGQKLGTVTTTQDLDVLKTLIDNYSGQVEIKKVHTPSWRKLVNEGK